MPYRRYGRRRYAKKKAPGRWQIYGAAGKQLFRDVASLKSLINVEKKYVDYSPYTNFSVATAGTLTCMNLMTQGTSALTRTGQSIKMVSFLCNGSAIINAAATGTIIRFMVFVDRQANGAAATLAQLLNTTDVYSPVNIGFSKRFRFLVDKRISLSANGTEIRTFKRFRKMSIHTEYNQSNNGNIGDIDTNSLWIAFISTEATNTPSVTAQFRLRFVDN